VTGVAGRAREALGATAALLLLVLAPALAGCPGTVGAVLRIDPPPPERGAPPDVQRTRIETAVREVGASYRLACTPGRQELLGCWPEALGSTPAFVSLHLREAGTGYEVDVDESFGPGGHPEQLCRIQQRLAERVDALVGAPSAHVDPRKCPAGGKR
jgi:hypothetical protein